MLHRIAAALVAFVLVPTVVRADDVQTLSVRSGHSIIIPAPGLSRLAVGDGRIAGIVPIARAEVIVNGKAPGETTLFIWRGGRRYTYDVQVSEQTIDDVAAMIRSTITDPGVQVVSFDRSVMLKGTVSNEEDFDRLQGLLTRFDADAKANKYTLVNALTVAGPLGLVQRQLASDPAAGDVRVSRDAKGNLVVTGHVADRVAAARVLERVAQSGASTLPVDAKVIDRLAVDTSSQVDVKVYILEVDRTALNQLGVRLQSGVPDPNHPGFYILSDPNFPALENVAPGAVSPAVPGRALNVGAFYRTTVLAPTLDLIIRNGHARVLSSPDLVTMPGREATFLVGGEIPIPFASGPGQVAITYKEFGVQLRMTPQILGNGGVETRIAPEVSDLDFQDGVIVSGFFVPALKTSRLSTDVVTHAGESIVMGGLLRRMETRNIDKLPLLGDIPVLGKLFRSTRYQKADTDVVFVMTPQVLER